MENPYAEVGREAEPGEEQQAGKRNLQEDHPGEEDERREGVDRRFHRLLELPVDVDEEQEEVLDEADGEEGDGSGYQALRQGDKGACRDKPDPVRSVNLRRLSRKEGQYHE